MPRRKTHAKNLLPQGDWKECVGAKRKSETQSRLASTPLAGGYIPLPVTSKWAYITFGGLFSRRRAFKFLSNTRSFCFFSNTKKERQILLTFLLQPSVFIFSLLKPLMYTYIQSVNTTSVKCCLGIIKTILTFLISLRPLKVIWRTLTLWSWNMITDFWVAHKKSKMTVSKTASHRAISTA